MERRSNKRTMRPFERWLLSSHDLEGHRWNEVNRAYMFRALEKHRDANRYARIRRIVAVIGPIILASIVVALWLWFGQR